MWATNLLLCTGFITDVHHRAKEEWRLEAELQVAMFVNLDFDIDE
jgi:hypothetical protein